MVWWVFFQVNLNLSEYSQRELLFSIIIHTHCELILLMGPTILDCFIKEYIAGLMGNVMLACKLVN